MTEETFLARWSRRKAEARIEGREEAEPAAAPVQAPAPEPEGETPPAPHPAELVDIDSLTSESDFTIFMQKGVPEEVKRKALRKLWTSDPVLANLDGLNDYDLDLSPHGHGVFAGTAWRIGQGFAWLDALGEQAEGSPEAEADAAPADEAAEADETTEADAAAEAGEAAPGGETDRETS